MTGRVEPPQHAILDPSTASGRPGPLSRSGLAAAAAGIALFVYFVERTGVADIAAGAGRLGWIFLVVAALGGLRLAARALAWAQLPRRPAPADPPARVLRHRRRRYAGEPDSARPARQRTGQDAVRGRPRAGVTHPAGPGRREPLLHAVGGARRRRRGGRPDAPARPDGPLVDRRRGAGGDARSADRRRPRGHLAAPASGQRSPRRGGTTPGGGRYAPGLGRTGAPDRGSGVRPCTPVSPAGSRFVGRLGAGLPRPRRPRDLPRPRVRQRRGADPPRCVRPRIDQPPPGRRVQGRPAAHRGGRGGHRRRRRAAGIRRRRRGHPRHRAQGAHAGLDDRRGSCCSCAGASRPAETAPARRWRTTRDVPAPRGAVVVVMARSPIGGRAPKSRAGRGAPRRAGPAAAVHGLPDRRRLDVAARWREPPSGSRTPPDGGPHGFAPAGVADGELMPQRGAGLGDRERGIFEDLLRGGFSPVVLIGSDLPGLPAERMGEALARLAAAPDTVVLGTRRGRRLLPDRPRPFPDRAPGAGPVHRRSLEQRLDPRRHRCRGPAVRAAGRAAGRVERYRRRGGPFPASNRARRRRRRAGAGHRGPVAGAGGPNSRAHTSRRPSIALSMVISSAYSRSLPTGTPIAMRLTRTPSGLSSFAR